MSMHNSLQIHLPDLKFFPIFNGRVVPKQQNAESQDHSYASAAFKTNYSARKTTSNTIKTAIRVRAPRSRDNLITILYRQKGGEN